MLSVDVQAIGWAVYLFDRHSCLWFSKIISGFQVRYHPGDLAQFLADFPVTEAMAGENLIQQKTVSTIPDLDLI